MLPVVFIAVAIIFAFLAGFIFQETEFRHVNFLEALASASVLFVGCFFLLVAFALFKGGVEEVNSDQPLLIAALLSFGFASLGFLWRCRVYAVRRRRWK